MRSIIAFFLMALFVLSISDIATAESRLNVLLITVDDMNWDSVGAFGCEVEGTTPNIDKLATEGVCFDEAHVTIAICQPTRAVWMTGRYPHRNGALGFDPITKGVPTLLETLHDAGYRTGIMAKVNHVLPTRGKAWDTVVQGSVLQNGRNPELYHQHAKSFFEEAKRSGSPFFLMANSQDPHRPFAGSQQERGRRQGNQAKRKFAPVTRTYTADEIVVPKFLPDIPPIRKELAEYFTSVHRADEIVGAVLRALSETELADNTLVLFMSDHGMPLPFAKTNCYRESTKTPWIVRWPGVTKAGTRDAAHLISGVDVTPTILEACGLPAIEGVDGRSIVPLLKGETQANRDYVFTYINRTAGKREFPMRSVVGKRYGYIWNGWADGETIFRNESQNGLTMKAMIAAARSNDEIAQRVKLFLSRTPEEFYDYQADPAALNNLIDSSEHKQVIAEFRNRLIEHAKSTSDPALPQLTQSKKGSRE